MKKLLAIFLSILFAAGMIIPAAADGPTPEPTPEPPNKMGVIVRAWVNSGAGTYIQSGEIQCTTIEGGFYTLSALGSISFNSNDFTCLGELVWHVYHGYGGSHYSEGGVAAQVFDSDQFYYDSDFQTNGTSQIPYDFPNHLFPQLNGYGEAPAVTTGPEDGFGTEQGGYGKWFEDASITTYFYIHNSTKPPCSQNWQTVSTVGSGSIAATNESGVPATLVVGNEYRLTVSGGPWNDGAADRHDTAVKIGSDAWTPLSDFATGPQTDCTQGDPLDPTKQIVVFKSTDAAWKIRVNDLDGEFGDNSGGMNFLLETVQPLNPVGCESQFLRGNELVNGTIPANNSSGVHPFVAPPPPFSASWIEIVTSGGPWQNNSTGGDRYDIAIRNPDGSWSELSAATHTGCSTENAPYIDAFYQLPTNDGIQLRVNDDDGNWTNSGSMNYTIYAANYSPNPPGGCAALYHLGDQIKTVNVDASQKDGAKVGSLFTGKDISDGTENQVYYAIETSRVWYDGTTPEVWGALAASKTTPTDSDWHDISTFPTVACAVMLDPIGHWRVYIPVDKNADNYWVRAQEYLDTTWANNSGSLNFTIYKATYERVPDYTPGTMPGAGLCDAYYTKGTAEPAVTIWADNKDGYALPVLTAAKIYAVETSAGPWSNNGSNSYEVAISDDDGANWHNLSAWDSAVCAQSADGNHILVYFQALAGRHYMLRVYDPAATFGDNSGTINYLLYKNVTVSNLGNCADNYTVHEVAVADPKIPGWNPSGVKVNISKESASTVYAIEINATDYWHYFLTPGEHRYDAEISTDNGSHWAYFGPALAIGLCIIQMNEPADDNYYSKVYKIYFNAPKAATLLRTRSVDATAEGYLTYRLYKGSATPNPSPNPPSPAPPEWQAVCYENYLRPNYLFKMVAFQLPGINFGSLGTITFPSISIPLPAVDDWIAYLQWTVRSYFAWCPEHTAMLETIPSVLNRYEPFGTILELKDAITSFSDKVDAAFGGGGEGSGFAPYSVVFNASGGESGGADWQGILPVVNDNSPWAWSGSGPLTTNIGTDSHFDITGGEGGGESMPNDTQNYVDFCRSIFEANLGPAVSTGLCVMVQTARTMPFIWILIQLCMDVGVIWGFIKYIQKNWVNKIMAS